VAFTRLTFKSSSLIIEGGEENKEDKNGGEGFKGLNSGSKSSLNVRINISKLKELCLYLEGGNCILKSIVRR
jgi:hypothetical protein